MEDEVAFLRGLVAVNRVADAILEDCLERGLGLRAAVDVFLSQCARMVNASAGFVCLRGTKGPVLTRVLGRLEVDVHQAADWRGPQRLASGPMLFCTRLALGRLDLGSLGLVIEGRFEDGGRMVMELVEAIGEQLDSAVLAFLALTEGRGALERLDELARQDTVTSPRGRIGPYELLMPLGTGGMAQVLVARLREGRGARLVALKRILPHLASLPHMVEQFLEEARIGRRLSHPNLVTLLDTGESEGVPYLVMELVRGVDLDRLLRATRISPAVAVAIAVQALHGLHAAHTLRGEDGRPLHLVHRDVSPSNLVVGFDGQVKVLDFGVAKVRAGRAYTLPGVIKGKPLYMSPEQVRSEPLDARSDLFSLGLVLFEAFTGVRAFERRNEALSLKALCDEEPTRPGTLSMGLWKVVERALAKSREKRFASALEMAQALEATCTPASRQEVARLVSTHFADQQRELEDLESLA